LMLGHVLTISTRGRRAVLDCCGTINRIQPRYHHGSEGMIK
jgi:hypothetical protein